MEPRLIILHPKVEVRLGRLAERRTKVKKWRGSYSWATFITFWMQFLIFCVVVGTARHQNIPIPAWLLTYEVISLAAVGIALFVIAGLSIEKRDITNERTRL